MAYTPSPRPLVEDSLRIDLADPSIRRAVARAGRGVLSWCMDGVPIASVGYTWNAGCLELRYSAQGQQQRQLIRTTRTPTAYGGQRLWWLCPRDVRPVRVMLLPPGCTQWAGRRAHGAAYASQRAPRSGWSAALQRALRDPDRDAARCRRNAIRRLRRHERTDG